MWCPVQLLLDTDAEKKKNPKKYLILKDLLSAVNIANN
jgi:hypothetical protein